MRKTRQSLRLHEKDVRRLRRRQDQTKGCHELFFCKNTYARSNTALFGSRWFKVCTCFKSCQKTMLLGKREREELSFQRNRFAPLFTERHYVKTKWCWSLYTLLPRSLKHPSCDWLHRENFTQIILVPSFLLCYQSLASVLDATCALNSLTRIPAQDGIISIKTKSLSHIIISKSVQPGTSFILTKWKSSPCLLWNRSANLCVLCNFSSFQVRITDSYVYFRCRRKNMMKDSSPTSPPPLLSSFSIPHYESLCLNCSKVWKRVLFFSFPRDSSTQ